MAQQLTWTPINPDFSNSNRLRESASRTISEVGDTFGRISDSLNKRIEEENRQKQLEFTNAMEQQRFGLLQEADRRANDQLLIEQAKYENEVAEQQRLRDLEQAKGRASVNYDNFMTGALDKKTGKINMDLLNKSVEEYSKNASPEEMIYFSGIYDPEKINEYNLNVDRANKLDKRAGESHDAQMAAANAAQKQIELQNLIAMQRMYAYNVGKAQGLNEHALQYFVNDHLRRTVPGYTDDPIITAAALENESKSFANATTLSDSNSFKSIADYAKASKIPAENWKSLYASYELAKDLTDNPKMTESQYLNVMLPKMAVKNPLFFGDPKIKGIEEEDIIDAFGLAPKGEPKGDGKEKPKEEPKEKPSVPTELTYTPTAAQANPHQEQLGDAWTKLRKDADQVRIKKAKELESANEVLSGFSDKVNFDVLNKNPSSRDISDFRLGILGNPNLTVKEKKAILKALKTKYQ